MLINTGCDDAKAESTGAGEQGFVKYVYSGDGDPWNDNIRIDIPFDFETSDCEITWWIKNISDGSWGNAGSGWFKVKNNQTYFVQCGDCAKKWKCIIINYSETG